MFLYLGLTLILVVILGHNVLSVLNHDKHLGVHLACDENSLLKYINGCISRGRRSSFAALGLGSKFSPLPPTLLGRLYWSISVPQMTYGQELVPLCAKAEQALETDHISTAKIIQGLPWHTTGPDVLAPLKWMSMHAYLAYKRLLLLWQLLLFRDKMYM